MLDGAQLAHNRWSPFISPDLILLAFYLLETILSRLAVTQMNNHKLAVQFIKLGKGFPTNRLVFVEPDSI